MTFEFDITMKDYVDFNKYHMRNSKAQKRLYFFLMLVIFCCYGYTFRHNIFSLIISITIFSVLILISYTLFDKFLLPVFIKASINEGKSNDFIGPQILQFEEDCIRETTVSITSQFQYMAIEKLGYFKGSFYVYIGAIKAFIVPVSAFENDEQIRAFLTFIYEKTGKSLKDKDAKKLGLH